MGLSRTTVFMMAILSAGLSSGCRSRTAPGLPNNTRDLEIEMVDISGTFEPSDRYQYDLKDCGSKLNFLRLDMGGILRYQASNVVAGTQCKLEVLDPEKEGLANVKWLSGRPGVIFYTRNLMVIDRGSRGQLRGVAMLSPGVVEKNAGGASVDDFTVIVPVDFGTVDPLTFDPTQTAGILTCEPGVGIAGVYRHDKEHQGTFRFVLTPPLPDEQVTCSRITVSLDGKLAYRGQLGISASFTATPGAEAILSTAPVRMEEIPPDAASGIEVILRSTQCKEDEVFDPTKGENGACVPKTQ